MSGLGWTCSLCTYNHTVPSDRCAMCNELRVSREQMRDFINGKAVPGADPLLAKRPPKSSEAAASLPSASRKRPLAKASLPLVNPYQRAGAAATNQQPTGPLSRSTPTQQTGKQIQISFSQSSASGRPIATVAPVARSSPRITSNTARGKESQPLVSSARGGPVKNTTVAKNSTTAANRKPPRNPFLIAQQVARSRVYQPGHVPFDQTTIANWIYPVDEKFPKRQYQFEISQTGILHNTLVSLPTGLGKTLVAAVVMYNYYRWFPTGKVIFLAPTLPLVNQQVKACHGIMGIPAAHTAVLTGKTKPERRAAVWKEKRAFFCTPQTVQKDLESQGCDPMQVVCLVLDEAHKSTGDYAYTKIVEYLTNSGAQFRILALSATPGTNIKAIQQVVDALHINKIEARTDTDPDVKKYIHQRVTEYVVVQQTDGAEKIKSALYDILGPILERLRSSGAPRLPAHSNISGYQLLKSLEEFKNRNMGSERLSGYFFAAQKFCQLRDDLERHGVGGVRRKLSQLREQTLRGTMSNIVKGKEFQKLWEEVCKASCDPNAKELGVQDQLEKNPKLQSLNNILNEHFERARLNKESSRAIVFSQFRDSVSEIVSILKFSEPLLKPRYFVGQGKGSKGSDGTQVKGMKQAEQHEVIRQFREGRYNVLVCTCIGEEGLDIGEVDLIVNFDTLRSPIRTIQRIGRTGRKRNGRVVCLVAAGTEENTLKASQQLERNLVHALRNPRSFEVRPTLPMLPSNPSLCERRMTVADDFRVSQVEGHQEAKKRTREANADGLAAASSSGAAWKLTNDEEKQRRQILGDEASTVPQDGGSSFFSSTLRRRFTMARNSSVFARRGDADLVGRTSRLLRHIENTHGISLRESVPLRRMERSTAKKVTSLSLFPVCSDAHHETYVIYDALIVPVGESSSSHGEQGRLQAQFANSRPDTHQERLLVEKESGKSSHVQSRSSTHCQQSKNRELTNPYGRHRTAQLSSTLSVTESQPKPMAVATNDLSTTGIDAISSKVQKEQIMERQSNDRKASICVDRLPRPMVNPYSHHGQNKLDRVDPPQTEKLSSSLNPLPGPINTRKLSSQLCAQPSSPQRISTAIKGPHQPLIDKEDISSPSPLRHPMGSSARHHAGDAFSLPTPPESSSSEEDNDNEDTQNAPHQPSYPQQEAFRASDDFCLPDPSDDDDESDEEESNRKRETTIEDGGELDLRGLPDHSSKQSPQMMHRCVDEFCLPSQSSSSEDESESEQSQTSTPNSRQIVAGSEILMHRPEDRSACPVGNESLSRREEIVDRPKTTKRGVKVVFDATQSQNSCSNAQGATRPSLSVNERCSTEPHGSDDSSTSSEEPVFTKKVSRRRVRAILDATQSSETFSNSGTPAPTSTCSTGLTNSPDDIFSGTPLKEDEIRCAVCHSEESLDDDPIILCDGVRDGVTCNLAVHTTCYSVTSDFRNNEEWRCDPCEATLVGSTTSTPPICSICRVSGGALKRFEFSKWKHVKCPGARQLKKLGGQKMPAETRGLQRPPLKRVRDNIHPSESRKETRRRRMRASCFMDEEAGIDSEDDADGDHAEEADIEAIEAEEADISGFINDSSQLGYSPDNLEAVDPDAGNDTTHRTLDIERARAQEFATPLLNRRMQAAKSQDSWSQKAPDSASGLGNMHFIRSVIQHHEQGGRAEDIEKLYHQMEVEEGPIDEDSLIPSPEKAAKMTVYYQSSDSD